MPQTDFSNFKLIEACSLPSLSSTGSWYRHSSGLEVLCIQNEDRENLFALGFSTLPHDSTGVPHILEHTVLSGSEQYPLRDPFIALIQSSLATFINAMTYSDRTLFPVSSCNHQDLFNLARVYWDSVFHPLLLKESFHQEGWHYELKKGHDKQEQLICNGIVLNEMKGAYSDLDSIYERSIYQYLLPETPLANDSGGNPEKIINLSYQQFLDFYRNHYALSRGRVLFYGNIPLEEKLSFLNGLLEKEKSPSGDFPPPLAAESAPLQKKWRKARTASVTYPSDFVGEKGSGCAFALAWNLGPVSDPVDDLAILLLDFILFGNDSSVMNRTLLESGLCESLLTCGCDDDYQETIFQIGVRGVRQNDFAEVENLIFATLQKLGREGISPEIVRTAFRQLQLDQYEIDSEHCLNILEDVFATWHYDRHSPFTFLQRDCQFRELKKRLQDHPSYMTELLDRLLLRNPHLLKLEMIPDSSFLEKREARLKKEMARRLGKMNEKDRRDIRRDLRNLRSQQKKEDRPEDCDRLPKLCRNDLSLKANALPSEEIILNKNFRLQKGNIFTNGLNYLCLAFDISALPEDLQSCLPFFLRLFSKTGTADLTYSSMADKMAANAMSLKMTVDTGYTPGKPQQGRAVMILTMKTLDECFSPALELLDRQWTEKNFHEEKRIMELLRQHWSQLRDEILQNGQYLATGRAALGLTRFAFLNDELHGISHVRNSRTAACGNDKKQLLNLRQHLDRLARWFSRQVPCAASFSGNERDLPLLEHWLQSRIATAVSCQDYRKTVPDEYLQLPSYGRKEIIPLNNGGACCAKILAAPGICDAASPCLAVYAQLLSCGYLWEKIRMEGGAYGVNCQYQPFNGIFSFLSSEDPHPDNSFRIFNSVPDMNFKSIWSSGDIDSAIIACTKGDDRPWRPAQVTSAALLNKIYGYTEDMRQERREALLSLKPEQLFQAIEAFWQNASFRSNDCLVGPAHWGKRSGLSPVIL